MQYYVLPNMHYIITLVYLPLLDVSSMPETIRPRRARKRNSPYPGGRVSSGRSPCSPGPCRRNIIRLIAIIVVIIWYVRTSLCVTRARPPMPSEIVTSKTDVKLVTYRNIHRSAEQHALPTPVHLLGDSHVRVAVVVYEPSPITELPCLDQGSVVDLNCVAVVVIVVIRDGD